MNKPIFGTKWYKSRKSPSLQIKILKLIMSQGELSKSKANTILNSNYSDISDAMKALTANDLIKFSHETGRRRPEKFYKITEDGLRAVLSNNMTSKENIFITSARFWRAILLLSVCSKQPISDKELDNCYRQFEKSSLGHSAIHGYFSQSYFFDIMLDNWLRNVSKNFATQKVIECLAINRKITLDELMKETGLKRDEIIVILQNHTIQTYFDLPALTPESKLSSDFDVHKQYYSNVIFHALISETGETYELSLFGIMLMISLICYHHTGTDSNRPHTTKVLDLFRNDIKPKRYYDIIAENYKEKLPLIFEKWGFLKGQLGSLLYGNFVFLIYKKTNKSIAHSIWIGGNKEFYEDIQALASNTQYYLTPLIAMGRSTLDEFQQYNRWDPIDPRIFRLRQKLRKIESTLYTDIPLAESAHTNRLSFANESESKRLDRVKKIENSFREELTFLFYLNLNNIAFSARTGQWLSVKEQLDLSFPIDRLMAILTKDNDIKKWFTERISDITQYRNQTLSKMNKFYNEILDSQKYIEKEQNDQRVFPWELGKDKEFDINKICINNFVC